MPRIVTLPWGGQGVYDEATGKVTPLTNPLPAIAPAPQDRGFTMIAPPTNRPPPVVDMGLAHRLALATAPPRKLTRADQADYAWAVGSLGLTDAEARELFGD